MFNFELILLAYISIIYVKSHIIMRKTGNNFIMLLLLFNYIIIIYLFIILVGN